jgi:adhesin/invasin
MNPASGTTNSSGQVTSVYISSTTSGWCKVTATEGNTGGSGSATLDQTATPTPAHSPYVVNTVIFNPTTLPADGASTATVTAHVQDTLVANVTGDAVRFTLDTSLANKCAGAALGGGSSAIATTDANGNAAVTYTAGTTVDVVGCKVIATEANTAQSGSGTEPQTTVPNTITVSANPSSIAANGTSSSTISITVTNPAGNGVAEGVVIGKSGNPTLACGTVPAAATTNSSGNASVVYISSTTTGFCTITVTDASGGSSTVTITQHA